MSQVIINADDFGLSDTVNQSIITAFERGILTSTTLLLKREATDAAVKWAKAHSKLAVGLHLDLDEFFCFESNGHFGITVDDIDRADYDYVTTHHMQRIRGEIENQIETIFSLGLQPTHLDGHHNIHLMPRVLPEVIDIARNFPINKIRFARKFYGKNADEYNRLKQLLDEARILYPKRCVEIDEYLPLGCIFEKLGDGGGGVSEVIIHTDLADTPANQWRVEQFEYVCSSEALELVDRLKISRVSYAELDANDR